MSQRPAIDWTFIPLDGLSAQDRGLFHRYCGWLALQELNIPIGKPLKDDPWKVIIDDSFMRENAFEYLANQIGSRRHFGLSDDRTMILIEYLILGPH